MAEISVSAFAADFFHIKRDLEAIKESGADSVHVDVMDGHFVPLFGFSQPWIREMVKWDAACGDVHLMARPEQGMLERLLGLPLQRLTLHVEAACPEELKSYLRLIKMSGADTGLALSPQTEPEELLPFLPFTDEILVMSCTPGTEGAVFQKSTYDRISSIRKLLKKYRPQIRIAVDGGLNEERALACIQSGADRVIIGRAFFAAEDRKEMVERVRKSFAGDL